AAVRLSGGLDVGRLRGALMVVAGRHEVLRTRFVEGVAGPVQVVGDEPAIEFVVRDVSGAGDPDAVALGAARDLAGLPFDLVAGPLVRVVVMACGAGGGPVGSGSADRPAAARDAESSGRPAHRSTRRRDGFPADGGCSGFSVLQSVLAAVLSRRSGQGDVVIGVPVANRSRVETEDLIGFFVNTLPLRTRVTAGDSFEELLDQVSRTALEGLSHQDVPFDRLVQELAPDRDRSRNPIFQVMLAFQNAPT
uniref:condensation domain-containing protein n=1 Tax=Streptomyces griseus TaxID=1911 RepID=UPI001F251703